MKKLFYLSLVLLTTCFYGNAQKAGFGLQAGTSIANYKFKYAGTSISGDSKAGITAGILVDIPASSNLIIQPALNFVQKGSVSEDMGEKSTININCLEIPVNLLYKTKGNPGSFFVGAGPSFAFNLSGKQKYEDATTSEEVDIEFGSNKDTDDMKGFEAGINFLAGYEFANGLFFSAGYNQGLSNLSNYSDDDESIKSSYFSFKIGFKLGTKK